MSRTSGTLLRSVSCSWQICQERVEHCCGLCHVHGRYVKNVWNIVEVCAMFMADMSRTSGTLLRSVPCSWHQSVNVRSWTQIKYVAAAGNEQSCAVFQASYCILSVTLVIGLIYRFVVIAETVEKFRSTYFEAFVDVSHVEYWDKVRHSVVLCFCCWYIEYW